MRQTILVVDDDRAILECITLVLEDEGFVVVPCGDGYEALERVQSQPIDLALVDLLMPRMDGRTLIAHLRATVHPDLPILVVSAYASFDNMRRLPVQGYVDKPFDVDNLIDQVRILLGDATPVSNGVHPSDRR